MENAMKENPLLADDELMELYCSKTGLPQTSYHDMIKSWDRINETLERFNEVLYRLKSSKQSRHKQLAQRELQCICNMMQTFEMKYKIRCLDSVPDAIRDYQHPLPPSSI
jgi:hypothetical protein